MTAPTQLDIFAVHERKAARPVQEVEADRVSSRIDAALVAFCRAHVGEEVRMQQLTEAVAAAVDGHVAPDSPGRRFRALRVAGDIQARNTDRSQSLYRIDGVR